MHLQFKYKCKVSSFTSARSTKQNFTCNLESTALGPSIVFRAFTPKHYCTCEGEPVMGINPLPIDNYIRKS